MQVFTTRPPGVTPNAEFYGNALDGVENMPRYSATDMAVSLGPSGNLWFSFFTPARAKTISKLVTASGNTAAAATPTLCRVGLYSSDGTTLTLVAAIASDTALWAATYTEYERALDTGGGLPASYTVIPGQRYAWGIICTSAGAMPELYGVRPLSNASTSRAPTLSRVLAGQTNLVASQAISGTAANNRVFWVGGVA